MRCRTAPIPPPDRSRTRPDMGGREEEAQCTRDHGRRRHRRNRPCRRVHAWGCCNRDGRHHRCSTKTGRHCRRKEENAAAGLSRLRFDREKSETILPICRWLHRWLALQAKRSLVAIRRRQAHQSVHVGLHEALITGRGNRPSVFYNSPHQIMALTIGTQFGSHEIISLLGKGGMGEVYRARDTKLGRDVAIKVLPEQFASSAERLARFEREARLLASLNHPNIAAIYGIEESAGTRFLILELVEGETLAERLTRGAMPAEDALQVALQVADALDAAHEKGVIHRDLKPANIRITPGSVVKVLDFGLAKALAEEESPHTASDSPTISMAATQHGVILGTAAYMSPEQAKGRAAGRASDIWAFGCVLYEMLVGRPAFN